MYVTATIMGCVLIEDRYHLVLGYDEANPYDESIPLPVEHSVPDRYINGLIEWYGMESTVDLIGRQIEVLLRPIDSGRTIYLGEILPVAPSE